MESAWTESLLETLTASDPWAAAARSDLQLEGADFTIATEVKDAAPLGWLLEVGSKVDRSFRYATKAVETNESLGELFARQRRPIPVADGLQVLCVETGSFRLLSSPGPRIRRTLESTPALALIYVVGLVGSTVTITSEFAGEPEGRPTAPPVSIEIPGRFGPSTIEIPGTAEIAIENNGSKQSIRISP